MALQVCCGFEDNSLTEVTAFGGVTLDATYKRSGGYSLRMTGNTTGLGAGVILPLSGTPAEIFFQFGYMAADYGIWSTGHRFMKWLKGATELGCLVMESGTVMGAYTGAKASQVATGSFAMADGAWVMIEGRIKIDDSVGVIHIKANGNTILEFTGDTKPGADTGIDYLYIGNISHLMSDDYMYLDDIIVVDTSGSYMNTWTKGLSITKLVPDGAGNYSAWTPSAGNNYECVDEVTPVATDYVKATAAGNKDSYTMSAPTGIADISAVVARFYGQSGNSIKRLFRIGGADYLGGSVALPTAFGKIDDITYVSPASSAAWTNSDLTSLEVGMEAQ